MWRSGRVLVVANILGASACAGFWADSLDAGLAVGGALVAIVLAIADAEGE